MPKKMLIFGFGYTAFYIKKKLAHIDFDVLGTSRTKKSSGLIDFEHQDIAKNLDSVTHILISTPPTLELGDPVLFTYRELLKKHAHHIEWLGYFSSTSVYGDHQGRWVDESSASRSPGKQGCLRLEAEAAWTEFCEACNIPLHIFRLAGIYGPKRNALTRLKAGEKQTIYKEGQYFSRIHVEDIATIVAASIQNKNLTVAKSIYNIADNEPTPTHMIDDYAASLMHLPSPEYVPFEDAEALLSPRAKEFYAHNRRVSNAKVKQELSVTLRYPTYQEGLKKIYDDGEYE